MDVMKIAVIGAGAAGVSTAYELASDGHQVTVFEAHSAVAESASFATGPLLSSSMMAPPMHAPWPQGSRISRWISPSHIQIQRNASLRDLRWLMRRKLWSTEAFETILGVQYELLRLSQARLAKICHNEGFQMERGEGQIVLVDTEKQMLELQPKLDWLKAHGTPWSALDASSLASIEPALQQSSPGGSAIYFPEDAYGNCRQFVQLQRDRAMEMGVHFEFGASLTGFSSASGIEVHTSNHPQPARFDQVILCTGAQTENVLGMLGLRYPLTQIQSYSLSAAIREPLNAPRNAVLDLTSGIGMVRMGSRVRVTGGAELGRGHNKLKPETVRALYQTIQKHFPGGIHLQSGSQLWKGCSVFTGDGAPLIGPSGAERVWLNTAHGYLGWGMACGSARLLADLIKAKTPAIDPAPYAPARLKV